MHLPSTNKTLCAHSYSRYWALCDMKMRSESYQTNQEKSMKDSLLYRRTRQNVCTQINDSSTTFSSILINAFWWVNRHWVKIEVLETSQSDCAKSTPANAGTCFCGKSNWVWCIQQNSRVTVSEKWTSGQCILRTDSRLPKLKKLLFSNGWFSHFRSNNIIMDGKIAVYD